jgi:hypothetical protein
MLESFYQTFQADAQREAVSTSILDQYAEKIPKELKHLWQTDGFGHYNQGLFQLVDPKDFRSVLDTWLGKTVDNYTPFAITAFGELFYYRKLSPTEGDICLVDIQFRKIEVIAWEMDDFLDNFLTHASEQEEWLRKSLFDEALQNLGVLSKNEVYTLAPILALGGAFSLNHLSKGNAQVYQELVFAMTS